MLGIQYLLLCGIKCTASWTIDTCRSIDDIVERLLKNADFVHAPSLFLHKETYAKCRHLRQAQL